MQAGCAGEVPAGHCRAVLRHRQFVQHKVPGVPAIALISLLAAPRCLRATCRGRLCLGCGRALLPAVPASVAVLSFMGLPRAQGVLQPRLRRGSTLHPLSSTGRLHITLLHRLHVCGRACRDPPDMSAGRGAHAGGFLQDSQTCGRRAYPAAQRWRCRRSARRRATSARCSCRPAARAGSVS